MKRWTPALASVAVSMGLSVAAVGCNAPTKVQPDTIAAPGSTGKAAPVPQLGATIQYMPKDCDVRAFVNAGKLFDGDVGKELDQMKAKVLGEQGDKGKRVDEALTLAGFHVNAMREVSLCTLKNGRTGLVAAAFDTSGFNGSLADVLAKGMEAASGKAPEKKVEGGVAYLTGDKKDEVVAIKGDVLLTGDSVDELTAASTGKGDGAPDYAGATQFVLWIKSNGGTRFQAKLAEAGTDYQLDMTMPPPSGKAAAFKADPKKTLDAIKADLESVAGRLEKMNAVKKLSAALRSTTLSVAGSDDIALSSTFPQSALPETLDEMVKDPKLFYTLFK